MQRVSLYGSHKYREGISNEKSLIYASLRGISAVSEKCFHDMPPKNNKLARLIYVEVKWSCEAK